MNAIIDEFARRSIVNGRANSWSIVVQIKKTTDSRNDGHPNAQRERGVYISRLVRISVHSPLTTREQGGLIGAGLGAGSGAIIGSTVGHAAVGALIGGPVGLIAGALIGDQLMGQERTQDQQQRQIDLNAAELERLRRENQRLREESPASGN